jgi:putative addiction module component (TIGR02574 family)
MGIKEIEAEELALPSEERASLAHRLLLSLEEISDAEFDRLWGDESSRRAAEVDSGRVQTIPADEVARKAKALLR